MKKDYASNSANLNSLASGTEYQQFPPPMYKSWSKAVITSITISWQLTSAGGAGSAYVDILINKPYAVGHRRITRAFLYPQAAGFTVPQVVTVNFAEPVELDSDEFASIILTEIGDGTAVGYVTVFGYVEAASGSNDLAAECGFLPKILGVCK